jgi:glucose-6-phosphate 1-dehydrogenase
MDIGLVNMEFDYKTGSWGPRDADELMTRDGRAWKPVE